MPFKTFLQLKKCKSSEASGGRPLQTLKLEGTRPLRPHPAFDAKAIAYETWRVGTSGISLSKLLRWLKLEPRHQFYLEFGEIMPS